MQYLTLCFQQIQYNYTTHAYLHIYKEIILYIAVWHMHREYYKSLPYLVCTRPFKLHLLFSGTVVLYIYNSSIAFSIKA